jgi:hypothetical protein
MIIRCEQNKVVGLFSLLLISILLYAANAQQAGCSLPTCTLTTTTTTDILTIASVVNLTTTITVSQAVQLQCVNSTSTTTFFTSTCTSCIPTRKIDTCGFSNGGFVVIFEPKPFLAQVSACKALGFEIAELSFENFPVAAEVARKCLGQQRKAYIKSYEGDAKPCLVLNTGDGKKCSPVLGANIEITCCTTHYPAICQVPREPEEVCIPECNLPQCKCQNRDH